MKPLHALFALVALAGLSFAGAGISDPYMEAKYQSVECYAMFADDLISYVQGLYDANDPPAPDSLEEMRDDLWEEGGMMYNLYMYGVDGNRASFNSQVRTVMSQVNLMKSTFRADARAAILAEWNPVAPYPNLRAELVDFYGNERSGLQSCLGGAEIDPPPIPDPR